jgi:arylsulfatase
VSVDTLRADHLGVYGYDRPTSPWLDAFAAGAVVFEEATTPRTQTTPAVASMLTGLYPHRHGVRTIYQRLPPEPVTLAEMLRAGGYATAAFVSNFVLRRDFSGLERGFDVYDDHFPTRDSDRRIHERLAADTCDAVLEWAKEAPPSPWFLWVHFMDPHRPYLPPERFFEPRGVTPLPPEVPLARSERGKSNVEEFVARYDGEIRSVDRELARMFAALEARGMLADTLVLFTADHGESLGEHGVYFDHGRDVFEPCARIPLLVRFPEGRGAGARARAPVSLVDVVPTILDAIGLRVPLAFDGVSVLRWVDDPRAEGGARFLEHSAKLRAVRSADRKIVATLEKGRVVRVDRYALREDPGEIRPVSADDPGWRRLEEWLRAYVERSADPSVDFDAFVREARERLSEEARRALRELGYL